MRKMWVFVALLGFSLGGCWTVERRQNEDGTTVVGSSPAEQVANSLGFIFPWLPGVVGLGVGAIEHVRKRKYAKALTATVTGLEDIFDRDGDGTITKEELKAVLSLEHAKAGIQPFISGVIQSLK